MPFAAAPAPASPRFAASVPTPLPPPPPPRVYALSPRCLDAKRWGVSNALANANAVLPASPRSKSNWIAMQIATERVAVQTQAPIARHGALVGWAAAARRPSCSAIGPVATVAMVPSVPLTAFTVR